MPRKKNPSASQICFARRFKVLPLSASKVVVASQRILSASQVCSARRRDYEGPLLIPEKSPRSVYGGGPRIGEKPLILHKKRITNPGNGREPLTAVSDSGYVRKSVNKVETFPFRICESNASVFFALLGMRGAGGPVAIETEEHRGRKGWNSDPHRLI
ncbi:hypothetical protein CEXT_716241 [Caerostris extrusa]|uniref:Uncharacterized protein n=1 Tax=Caerostris extrusa TaxID=172846 RepID=A0AAV4QPP4_CAEEX|nr:hypothetical protein CEXT_716241 [Caerostris extrusa]